MKKSLSILGKEAQEKHKKILDLKKTMSVGFLLLGMRLKEMKDNKYFKFIMGEDSTWIDYCSEIDIDRNHAYMLIRIYEMFILKFQFEQEEVAKVDSRKLIALLPIIADKEKEEVKDLLDNARALNRPDFFLKLKQLTNPPETCEHQPKEVHYFYCLLCNEKLTPEEVKKYGRK